MNTNNWLLLLGVGQVEPDLSANTFSSTVDHFKFARTTFREILIKISIFLNSQNHEFASSSRSRNQNKQVYYGVCTCSLN